MTQTINHNGIEVIELDSIRSNKYDDNIERLGDHSNTCFICGKPTAKNLYVHYSTDGHLIPINVKFDQMVKCNIESQGFFPIGSECAKKIGKSFITNL